MSRGGQQSRTLAPLGASRRGSAEPRRANAVRDDAARCGQSVRILDAFTKAELLHALTMRDGVRDDESVGFAYVYGTRFQYACRRDGVRGSGLSAYFLPDPIRL